MKFNLKKTIRDLSFQILVAMILGIVVGRLMGDSASMFAPLGTLFIQLIKMLVVPLVFISIVSGSSSLGATRSAGRIGLTTILFVFITTLTTVMLAFAGSWIIKPGEGIPIETIRAFFPEQNYNPTPEKLDFWTMIIGIIPANPIQAMAEGNILQIIFFGLFLGF